MPYMSRYLTLNLYPLALLSGALCLAGLLTRRKEEKQQPP